MFVVAQAQIIFWGQDLARVAEGVQVPLVPRESGENHCDDPGLPPRVKDRLALLILNGAHILHSAHIMNAVHLFLSLEGTQLSTLPPWRRG